MGSSHGKVGADWDTSFLFSVLFLKKKIVWRILLGGTPD